MLQGFTFVEQKEKNLPVCTSSLSNDERDHSGRNEFAELNE